jgi:hypothetical protein
MSDLVHPGKSGFVCEDQNVHRRLTNTVNFTNLFYSVCPRKELSEKSILYKNVTIILTSVKSDVETRSAYQIFGAMSL